MTTLDLFVQQAVAAHPDTEALVDAPNRSAFFTGEPMRLTWTQLNNAVNALASTLQSAGIGVGDPVAIQLPNVVELPISLLACFRIGAVATPFPIQHREHELRHGLAVSGARHLITAARPDRVDVLETSMEVLAEFDGAMFTFGDTSIDGAVPLELSQGPASEPTVYVADPTDVATICWTSGTTGTPKGVPRAHNMWLASSDSQVTELELTANERILCPFPVVNMAGIGGMLVPWLQTGSTLLLHHPIDLPVFLGQISSEAITYTVAPPPLLNMLLRNETMLDSVDMSHIRKISSGSAPLPRWRACPTRANVLASSQRRTDPVFRLGWSIWTPAKTSMSQVVRASCASAAQRSSVAISSPTVPSSMTRGTTGPATFSRSPTATVLAGCTDL